MAGGGAAHRLRRARLGVHFEAHRDIAANGRQPILPGREGGGVPARVLRGVPLPDPAFIRPHGGDLRGHWPCDRPRRGTLRHWWNPGHDGSLDRNGR